MNTELKAKFQRRLNTYADIWPRPKDKRLQRRADRLIEDIYRAGWFDAQTLYLYFPKGGRNDAEAGVADVMEFHKAAGGKG